MPRYKRLTKAPVDPYRAAPLPVDRPSAVYYRQSSEAQIGNISTTLLMDYLDEKDLNTKVDRDLFAKAFYKANFMMEY